MGFDIECIIDIQKYPGEYFCPVCRTLVYPNEALQSQCTHLYCKPCLAHVANNTRACPYDGYLVTEADSKPLIESDKALAENIGKVKVHCLYHRSGCTWDGPLSECTQHCSGCAFGNSPVICNRCGIQIVHRQVHDHAQSCPGVYQVQQAADAAEVVSSSGLTAASGAANQNQATSQAGAPTSQAQNTQSAPAPLVTGQDSNQQANANSQAPATVPSAVPTTEQWYQQQYQQYYQQYAGYDPYQHAYPQYYPYQQAAVQQYQQHPPQVLGQQPQLYAQVAAQVPVQSSTQPQLHPQTQHQPQHPGQPMAQPQPPTLPQPVQSQIKTQAQVQPHGTALIHSQVQPLAPQSQSQVQANPQQLLHPAMQSQTQIPSQAHSIPGLPVAQTQQYNQPQPHPVQPQPQHVQAHYQQPHLPMHHPQPSQVPLQSHILPQTQPQPQPQPQPHPQIQSQPQPQPQPQIQPQPQVQPHLRPTLPNQPAVPSGQPPPLHSSGHAVSGHQSYVQPQPPQQQAIPAHPASGSLPPGQMPGQVLPQPLLMRPPSQVSVPNQQQAQFPSQGQVSSLTPAQQQQYHSQTPLLSHPNQLRPVIHSSQQQPLPQQYVQQHPFSHTVPSHHNLAQPQPQLRPQGPAHIMQQSSNAYPQLQQNVAVAPGVQPQQPQNYVGRPVMPNQVAPTQPQPFTQSSSGFITGAQVRPGPYGPYQRSPNQNYANKTNNQLQVASDQLLQSGMTSASGVVLRQGDNVSEKTSIVLPSQSDTEKVANASRVDSTELKPLKSDAGISYEQDTTRESTENLRKNESLVRDADNELHGGIDGSGQPVSKLPLKEEQIGYPLEHSSDVKSNEEAKQRDTIGDVRTDDVESLKGQKPIFVKAGDESSQVIAGPVNQQKSAGPPMLQSLPPVGPPSRALVPEYPSMPVRPQGSGLLPQPRQPLNSNEQFQAPLLRQSHDVPPGVHALGSTDSFGRGPVPFGAPQGPPLTADPRGGIMGRVPQHGPEGQLGLQRSVNPVEAEMLQKQRQSHFDGEHPKLPGAFERGPFGHPSGVEPNALRLNGGPGFEQSSLGTKDERFKALPGEHLNPFMKEPTWHRDQGSRPLDRAPPGLNYDAGLTMDSAGGGPASRVLPPFHPPGGPGMVRHDAEHMIPRNTDREYLGWKAHSYGEGSRHNLPLDQQGNPLHENRFLPSPGYPHRGDHDGPEGLRFGEHRFSGPHDLHRRADLFGKDIPPSHFRRGELLGSGNSPSHFGPFPGHTQMGEFSGPANLPHKFHYGEPFSGTKPGIPRLGEPGFRSSFTLHGFPSDGPFAGDMSNFDNSRKRKNMSMGWCRICKVDCETVEGLDMHSQTREHQKMSMDMVMSIKQQNKKRPKALNDRGGREVGNKRRNIGQEGRVKRP